MYQLLQTLNFVLIAIFLVLIFTADNANADQLRRSTDLAAVQTVNTTQELVQIDLRAGAEALFKAASDDAYLTVGYEQAADSDAARALAETRKTITQDLQDSTEILFQASHPNLHRTVAFEHEALGESLF